MQPRDPTLQSMLSQLVRGGGVRALEFLRNEDGSELAEYALVLTFFVIVSMVAMRSLGVAANSTVNTNENNFSGALVNGY